MCNQRRQFASEANFYEHCVEGIDVLFGEQFVYGGIVNFIQTVSEKGGVNKFILHARKAFLKGLNPKENRNVPPLKYDWVLNLKKMFPHLEILINGGFTEIDAMHDILKPEN